MIYILSWANKRALKNTFQATTFKVEENSRTFQGVTLKFMDFSRLRVHCKRKIEITLFSSSRKFP